MSVLRKRFKPVSADISLFYEFPADSTYNRIAIDTQRAAIYVVNATSRYIERLVLHNFSLHRTWIAPPATAGMIYTGISYNVAKDELLVAQDANPSPVFVYAADGTVVRQFGSASYNGYTVYKNGIYYVEDLSGGIKMYDDAGTQVGSAIKANVTNIQHRGMALFENTIWVTTESPYGFYTMPTVAPYPTFLNNTGNAPAVGVAMMVVSPNGYKIVTDRFATGTTNGLHIYSQDGSTLLASYLQGGVFGVAYYNSAIYALNRDGKLWRIIPNFNL